PTPPATSTGCEYRNFLSGIQRSGQLDPERYPAFAMRLNTPLYREGTGDARMPQTLSFSQRVFVVDAGDGLNRLKVRPDRVSGWVDRNAVYCARLPLTDPVSGLYRRAVVKTSPALQGEVRPKKLFHVPEQRPGQNPDQRCEGGPSGCREVSRFTWYFIYAEENNHYLISTDANLGSTTAKLLGWLPKEDAIVWDTALGLRPI